MRFFADGPCSNVGVLYYPEERITSLVTNGHIDASDGWDRPVQIMLSSLPLLLRPQATDAAIVGWGCGQTIGAATLFPLKHVEAIELEPNVIAASRLFHHVNHHPETDARVRIRLNDGRNYLLATDEQFDVIVSEPSNPWQSGVCNLFTQEYFRICKERLKPGGLFSVWLQVTEVPPDDACAVFNAINSVFPHSIAFMSNPGDLIILASNTPITFDHNAIDKALKNPALHKELAQIGITSADSLLARVAVATDGMHRLTAGATNSDDDNKLEFQVGMSYENRSYADEDRRLLAALAGSPWQQVDWGGMSLKERAVSEANIADGTIASGLSAELAQAWIDQSLKLRPTAHAYRLQGMLATDEKQYGKAEASFDRALALSPDDPEVLVMRGGTRMSLNKREAARQDFSRALALRPQDKVVHYLLAMSYENQLLGEPYTREELASMGAACPAKEVASALDVVAADQQFINSKPDVLLLLAQANFKLNELAQADRYLQAFLKKSPYSVPGRRLALSLAALHASSP